MVAPNFNDTTQLIRPGEAGPEEYDVRIEIFDGEGRFLGEVGDYVSANVVWSSEAESVDASSFVIRHPSYWSQLMMKANRQLILVRIIVERQGTQIKKWTGRVQRSVKKNQNGEVTVTCELEHDKAWLGYLFAWSSPFANINTQLPGKDIMTGPAIFCLKKYLVKAVLRFNTDNLPKGKKNWLLYNHVGDRLSNFMDDSSLTEEALPYLDPFLVVPAPFNTDTSPIVTITAKMDSLASIWQDICKDFNLLPVVEMYYPGRDPRPSGAPITGRTTPSIVIDIIDKDKSRVRAVPPTGSQRRYDIASKFLSSIVGVFDTSSSISNHTSQSLQEFFGSHSDDKWVIFRESSQHWSSSEVASYSPTTVQTISGGSSMTFVNDIVQGLLMAAISFILKYFGLNLALDAILGDSLKDIFFAYQRTLDKDMATNLGKFAFYENYTGKGGTAYSFDAGQDLRSARWAAMGYRTATFSGDSSAFPPFRVFEDFDLLDPIGWEDEAEGQIFTERLKEVSMVVNRDEGVQFEIRLGEAQRPEEPWAIQTRQNARFRQAINAAFNKD